MAAAAAAAAAGAGGGGGSAGSFRFGILGTAHIAVKVGSAIARSSGCEVRALASRDAARARAYAAERRTAGDFDVPDERCFGSYEELLARDDVDAVYIPLPTAMHREWTEKAAAAGKHVLCEKPLAPCVADAQAMVDACAKAGVQLLDGVMFVHNERTEPLLEEVRGTVAPLRVNSRFSFLMADAATNIRCHASSEPLGSLGDLGWYCARFTTMCFGGDAPERVFGQAQWCEHGEKEGVPWSFSALLWYSGGRVASFDTSFGMEFGCWADVVGEKKALRLTDFVLPHERPGTLAERADAAARGESYYHAKSGWQEWSGRDRDAVKRVNAPVQAAQEVRMVENLAALARGNLDSAKGDAWRRDILTTQRIMDALMRSASQGIPVPLTTTDSSSSSGDE